MDSEPLQIVERCIRPTRGDQLWEAYAERKIAERYYRVGPVVRSHSRKSVRTKARSAYRWVWGG